MDEANILMGNDTTCKIMCIETVKIKMFDGVACMFFWMYSMCNPCLYIVIGWAVHETKMLFNIYR